MIDSNGGNDSNDGNGLPRAPLGWAEQFGGMASLTRGWGGEGFNPPMVFALGVVGLGGRLVREAVGGAKLLHSAPAAVGQDSARQLGHQVAACLGADRDLVRHLGQVAAGLAVMYARLHTGHGRKPRHLQSAAWGQCVAALVAPVGPATALSVVVRDLATKDVVRPIARHSSKRIGRCS